MRWFKRAPKPVGLIGANVIVIDRRGCMAHIHNIERIGVIESVFEKKNFYPGSADTKDFALCKDKETGEEFDVWTAPHYLQKLNNSTYLYYK